MSETEAPYIVEGSVKKWHGDMKASERRQEIRDLLIERRAENRGATVAELADKYNISPRQIRRDLQQLAMEPDYVPIVLDITYEWRIM